MIFSFFVELFIYLFIKVERLRKIQVGSNFEISLDFRLVKELFGVKDSHFDETFIR